MDLEKKQYNKNIALKKGWEGVSFLLAKDPFMEVVSIWIKFKSIGKDTPIFYERYLKDLSNEYAIKNTISSALAFTKSEYKKDNSLKLLKIKLKKQINTDKEGLVLQIDLTTE